MKRKQAINFLRHYNLYLKLPDIIMIMVLRDQMETKGKITENKNEELIEYAYNLSPGLSRDEKIELAKKLREEIRSHNGIDRNNIFSNWQLDNVEQYEIIAKKYFTNISSKERKIMEAIFNSTPAEERFMIIVKLQLAIFRINEGLEALSGEQKQLIDYRFKNRYKWVTIENIMGITTYKRKQIYIKTLNTIMDLMGSIEVDALMNFLNKWDKPINKKNSPNTGFKENNSLPNTDNLPPEYKKLYERIYNS